MIASWNALNESTVCWNTFTTGMPRTYSVARSAHAHESRLVKFHEMAATFRILAAHHPPHRSKGNGDGDKAQKPHPPVEQKRHDKEDHRGSERANKIRQLVGDEVFSLTRTPIDHAPHLPRRVRTEIPYRDSRHVAYHHLAHICRNTEGRKMRSHERAENTMILSTANTTANTAHIAADDASSQFGYTEIKSRTTNHTHTRGITVSAAFNTERPHPAYAKARRLPANLNSSRIAFFFLAGRSFSSPFPTPAAGAPSSRIIVLFTSRSKTYTPSLAKCFENTLVPMKPPTRPPAMVATPVTTPIGLRIELTSVWPYSRVMPA